ncbi:twin-arginine translocation pathway signal protein [Sulfitobacter alexandrii]|uniref:Twin-arginine translocation pathway signal protein n=1 Tax=Sulfitobacter alexandrii TaxID=1917485 RepID=A0A1J0WJ03_9RHOB|nr:twin-arginine translocation pathway signal protein [Sulfitobacter alexandrii]APE44283.1 twin-arginine translocation pathway signal protein [Sulfitobacter alexandrii]
MSLSRRKAISIIGGGTILAATGAAAGFLTTRQPADARRPWALAGSYDDPRLNAVSFALLAPNPHNLQPWLVELKGEAGLLLHRDPARRLPETDPFDRQIFIGLGCFIEQMVLAAGAAGHAVDLTPFPEGETGPVALATFHPGGAPDPLAAHILDRRSCKEPFEDRALPRDVVQALEPLADIHTEASMVAALRGLTWAGWEVEALTPRTMQESVDLMRFGKAEINADPDGIDLGGPMLESLMLLGIVNRAAQADPDSTGFRQGGEIYRRMLAATPAYAVLTTASNTRLDQIAAGRRWLRLNLAATRLGLSLHPVSQTLQEYPEMAVHRARAHALLASGGHTVQMLGRLGYGPATPRTPRWPLEAKLIAT